MNAQNRVEESLMYYAPTWSEKGEVVYVYMTSKIHLLYHQIHILNLSKTKTYFDGPSDVCKRSVVGHMVTANINYPIEH